MIPNRTSISPLTFQSDKKKNKRFFRIIIRKTHRVISIYNIKGLNFEGLFNEARRSKGTKKKIWGEDKKRSQEQKTQDGSKSYFLSITLF